MPTLTDAKPQIKVSLFKTISRTTVDGQAAVSDRYKNKDESIDLTPFLNEGSAVRTSKSVREPAGAFSISFADKPHSSGPGAFLTGSGSSLETVYALVEPMDIIEIRMWGGAGPAPTELPIKMRGFVTGVQRVQAMGQDGRPQRQVSITGQDYGKIWQMYQVIYLAAYAEGKALLTNFSMQELFGVKAVNTMKSADFVRTMIQKVINPFLAELMPENSSMPKEIQTGESIAVAHGVVNNSYQNQQGSILDILKFHCDVGYWNELYIEDRNDGVHCVYRPVPALRLSKDANEQGSEKDRKIQDDAPDPVVVEIPASRVKTLTADRSDGAVFNFYWVRNSRYDLIDDSQRQLASIPPNDGRVSLKDYPNAAVKYYGTRPLYAETQQGDDAISNMGSGQDAEGQKKRASQMESWIDKRRRLLMEMNKDNVVMERGVAVIKGGPMRDATEAMKAGDYAKFNMGQVRYVAYVTQIDDEFLPFGGYTTTLSYERGEGFVTRAKMEGGTSSPWLSEQVQPGIV